MPKQIFYPPWELKPYIDHYLFLDITFDKSLIGVCYTYPCCCNVMGIFYSNDLPTFIFPNKTMTNVRSFISGYLTKGVKIGNDGHFKCVIIQFTTLGAYHLFGIPPSEYSQTFVELTDIVGKLGSKLIEEFNLAKTTYERIDYLNSFFLRLLIRTITSITITELVANHILKNKGIVKIDQLVEQYQISLRNLDRKFNHLLGITPKDYIWLNRLNLAYKMLIFKPEYEISDIMFTLGYYDQSHMIRHFLKYSDITPHDLVKSNNKTFFSFLQIIQSESYVLK